MLQRVMQGDDRLGRDRGSMPPALRRGAIVSASLHVLILAALLIGLPRFNKPPEPPPETAVSMVFTGAATSSMLAPQAGAHARARQRAAGCPLPRR